MLVGVLRGLRALHEMRLIHGVLHPNNVFLDDNNNTCIADFDFTKTLVRSSFIPDPSYCQITLNVSHCQITKPTPTPAKNSLPCFLSLLIPRMSNKLDLLPG